MQASKVAKKKEAEKADKAERERERQEAQMAKAVKRARDAEAKKVSGKGTTNGEEPPAKRCAATLSVADSHAHFDMLRA